MTQSFFSSPASDNQAGKQLKQPGGTARPSRPPKSKDKKKGNKVTNLFLILGILVAIGLFAWAEMERRDTENRLEQTEQQLEEIRSNAERSGSEVATEVIRKVGSHIELPVSPEPTVATIVNAEELKANNEFYARAENGDHVIITSTRAILYSAKRDIIIDVVPVRLENPSDTAAQPEPPAELTDPAAPDTNTEPAPGV